MVPRGLAAKAAATLNERRWHRRAAKGRYDALLKEDSVLGPESVQLITMPADVPFGAGPTVGPGGSMPDRAAPGDAAPSPERGPSLACFRPATPSPDPTPFVPASEGLRVPPSAGPGSW